MNVRIFIPNIITFSTLLNFLNIDICVWNSLFNGRRLNNGIYNIVDDSKSGTDRNWIMDDFTSPYTEICQTYAKYFWNYDGNGRWFVGDYNIKDTDKGDCFCSSSGKSDPLTETCNDDEYYCGDQVSVFSTEIKIDNNIEIYFGLCPQLSDYCSSITVSSTDGYTECDGTYEAIDAPNGLINEMNIYKNQDSSNKENQYLYFDHTDFRWLTNNNMLYIIISKCCN